MPVPLPAPQPYHQAVIWLALNDGKHWDRSTQSIAGKMTTEIVAYIYGRTIPTVAHDVAAERRRLTLAGAL